MSSMRTKYAPLVPSSILLDKRWKEHDYLLHLYRLRALRGDHVLRPNLNNIYGNPSKKVRDVQSAKLNSTTQTVYLTNNNVISKRPHTAKYDLTDDFDVPPLKQRWIKSSTGSRQSNHKANVQESSNSETHLNFEKKSLWADSNFTDSRVIPIKQYELNEKKDEHSFSERPRKQFQSIYQLTNQKDLFNERSTSSYSFVNAFNSQLNSKKKTITAKYDLNGHLINRKPNAVISKLRPVKSDYSVASMKKHFEKQQYIRNVIHRNGFLHNSKQVQSKLNQKYKDDYSDVFESEVDEISLLSSSSSSMEKIPQIKSLPPSPSPEPPSRELTPLYIEPRFASMRTPTPPAMVLNKRPTPPVFVPPSHIIKIVKDAEFMDSDSELSPDTDKDSNFVVFAKEGQPGMFKRTDSGKVVKVKSIFNKHKKRRTRRSSKNFEGSSKLKDIVYIKYNTDDSTTSEEDNSKDRKLSSRKQSFLLSKQHSFEVQSNEQPSFLAFKQHSFEIQTSDEISEASSESEDVQSENENTQKLKRKTQISRLSNNEIDSNDDKEIKVSNEIHKNELNGRKMSFYAIEAQDDILNSQVEFDAKLIHESGSDVDEFGRRGTRDRPSSSIYHNLPPLHPDIVLDDDDVNKCKVRLMRNTVNIHEALAKNRYCDLEEVCEIIIMNNNDNRRWLRKMYRDEYLQSLLVDLRKSLPANVAGVISNMMIPACEYDAMCLWDALKGMHKDPEVVIEILITRSNEELEKIRKVYELRYNEELLDHIEDETTGVFQKILMKLATGQRDNQYEWTKEDAAKEARALSAW